MVADVIDEQYLADRMRINAVPMPSHNQSLWEAIVHSMGHDVMQEMLTLSLR